MHWFALFCVLNICCVSFEAKLNSCLDKLRNIVGDTCAESALVQACIAADFNVERAANMLLSQQGYNKINTFCSNKMALYIAPSQNLLKALRFTFSFYLCILRKGVVVCIYFLFARFISTFGKKSLLF